MNGGAYGSEVKDILVEAEVVLRTGERRMLALTDLDYSYRHRGLPEGAVVIGATFRGRPGEPQALQAAMDRISASREASQPLRPKPGGATYNNTDGNPACHLDHTASDREHTPGAAP